ncbi:MAG: hypothetical protein KF819_02030 [Labilithrix sp.]|nr:hypothetical protein [Labilithrix sp.]
MKTNTRTHIAIVASSFFFFAPRLSSAQDEPPRSTQDRGASADEIADTRSDDTTGAVGTISLLRPIQIGGSGSQGETRCASLGSQCAADAATGGGFMFSVGYMWKYLGFDVLGASTLDGGERSYVPHGGVRRSYFVERLGGMAAVRLRAQIQSEDFRGALAIGPGVTFRAVGEAASFPSVPKDGATYGSASFTADLSAQWRIGRPTALALGAMLWVEDAGSEVTTVRSRIAAQAGESSEFHLVSGMQASVMPYIGLQFGP